MEKDIDRATKSTTVTIERKRSSPERGSLEDEKKEIADMLKVINEPLSGEPNESESTRYNTILNKAKKENLTLAACELLAMQKESIQNSIERRVNKEKIRALEEKDKQNEEEKRRRKAEEEAKEEAIKKYGLERVGSEFFNDALKDLTIELVKLVTPSINLGFHDGKAFSYHISGYGNSNGWGISLIAYGLSAEHVNLDKDWGARLYTLAWRYEKGSGKLIPDKAHEGFCPPLTEDYTARLFKVIVPFLHKK